MELKGAAGLAELRVSRAKRAQSRPLAPAVAQFPADRYRLLADLNTAPRLAQVEVGSREVT